jgi:hypothetical protein
LISITSVRTCIGMSQPTIRVIYLMPLGFRERVASQRACCSTCRKPLGKPHAKLPSRTMTIASTPFPVEGMDQERLSLATQSAEELRRPIIPILVPHMARRAVALLTCQTATGESS